MLLILQLTNLQFVSAVKLVMLLMLFEILLAHRHACGVEMLQFLFKDTRLARTRLGTQVNGGLLAFKVLQLWYCRRSVLPHTVFSRAYAPTGMMYTMMS